MVVSLEKYFTITVHLNSDLITIVAVDGGCFVIGGLFY